MKIQDLAVIFLIIILPISLVMATYSQYQVQTINTQTVYDSKLTAATYDAIRAYQLNSASTSTAETTSTKNRDLQASVNTFRNSIESAFSLDGYSEDTLNRYIPALVYTFYDGLYIYSPYTNVTTTTDDDASDPKGSIHTDGTGSQYGFKPYISYSCHYVRSGIDVVITFALDNHIDVEGTINGEYVKKDGYLIDNIDVDNEEAEHTSDKTVRYNGVEIQSENVKQYLPLGKSETDAAGNKEYSYIKFQGVEYYLDNDNGRVISRLNDNSLLVQYSTGKSTSSYDAAKNAIENNNLAKDYYIDAYEFTKWFKGTDLINLTYSDAHDMDIDDQGNTNNDAQIWPGNNTKIFDFNTSGDFDDNIENESSAFNQHRLSVIRHKIEVNLSIAIANYNAYFNAADNVFEMPKLEEEEWYNLTHNISLISFLQGIPIGGKTYNGYSLVTNSESKEVVLEQNIYILANVGRSRKILQNR